MHTSRGDISAGDVLVATNGYTDAAAPWAQRRIIPIGSYIIATEPLGDVRAADVSPQRRMMSDTRNFLHYWRLSPDGRLVFGGRTSFAPVTVQTARDRLYAAMIGIYPQLAGVRISHAWTGNVGFTLRPAAPPHAVGRHYLRDGLLRQWRRAGQLDGNACRRVDCQGCPAGLCGSPLSADPVVPGAPLVPPTRWCCTTRYSIGSEPPHRQPDLPSLRAC